MVVGGLNMERDVEKICANCKYYTFKSRIVPEGDFGTWVYCAYRQEWFPNARGWVPSIAAEINAKRKAEGLAPAEFKMPGERTCSNFKA